MTEIHNLGELLRQTFNAEDTLCTIDFSDGSSTNDFIPNKVLSDSSTSDIEWWTNKALSHYIPIMTGEISAIKVKPIKN
jgi:hypothetical protein